MEKKRDPRWIMKEHENVSWESLKIFCFIQYICNINLFQQFEEYTYNTSDKSTTLEKFVKVKSSCMS